MCYCLFEIIWLVRDLSLVLYSYGFSQVHHGNEETFKEMLRVRRTVQVFLLNISLKYSCLASKFQMLI